MVVLACLVGCRTNPTQSTFSTLLPSGNLWQQLLPGFEYLQVSANGRTQVMALGERRTEANHDGPTVHEWWYNAQGEMLYLVNGRIAQALGFTHELRGLTAQQLPTWRSALQAQQGASSLLWQQQQDLMPGYRYGVTSSFTTYSTAPPHVLPEGVPHVAQWVADAVQSKTTDGSPWQYVQRFALVGESVVYSEQCVANTLCLALRPLGMAASAP